MKYADFSKNPEYAYKNANLTNNERKRVLKALKHLGVTVFPSDANFLLFHSEVSHLGEKIEDKGVLISDLAESWLPGYYRVTIGIPEENNTFLAAIKDVYKEEF